MNRLLVGGLYHEVPGLEVLSPGPGAPAWLKLDGRDYRSRRTPWVRQIIVHTTKGIWPQHLIPGKGPGGRDKIVADFWRGDPTHSAAQIVIDNDGSVAQLVDTLTACAYHATTSNDWSIGIEIYQEGNGGIYQAALEALVLLVPALCELHSIPLQIVGDVYRGTILERMQDGGPDCVGIFGHRDQAWMFPEWIDDPAKRARYPHGYANRGRGDPGDMAYEWLLARTGAEPLCYAAKGDIGAWKHRQARLNLWGAKLTVDGVCGPATMRAMRELGFAHGREIDAAVEDPRGA